MSILWNKNDESNTIQNIKHQIKILDLITNTKNLNDYINFLKNYLSSSDYKNYHRILFLLLIDNK